MASQSSCSSPTSPRRSFTESNIEEQKVMKARRARTLLKQISRDNVIRKSFGIDKNSVQSKAIPGNVVADGSTAPWNIREGWKILDDLPSLDAFGSTAPTKNQGVKAHTHLVDRNPAPLAKAQTTSKLRHIVWLNDAATSPT